MKNILLGIIFLNNFSLFGSCVQDVVAIIEELQSQLRFQYVAIPSFSFYRRNIVEEHRIAILFKLLSIKGILVKMPTFEASGFTLSCLNPDCYGTIKDSSLIVVLDNLLKNNKLKEWPYILHENNWKASLWLIIQFEVTDLNALFQDIVIKFDCQILVSSNSTITEVRKISPESALSSSIVGQKINGYWAIKDLNKRTTDLNGTKINCLTAMNHPYTNVSFVGEKIIVSGFMGKVWGLIENHMNFKYWNVMLRARGTAAGNFVAKCKTRNRASSQQLPPSDIDIGENRQTEYKFTKKNGSMFARILWKYGYDVGLKDTVTSSPALADYNLTFTVHVRFARLVVVTKSMHDHVVHWLNFLAPFSFKLWGAVSLCLLLLAISSWCMHSLDKDVLPNGNIQPIFAVVCAFLCQAIPATKRCWYRILISCTHFTALVLISGYSAYLISALAADRPPRFFPDGAKLIRDGEIQVGLVPESYELFPTNISSNQPPGRFFIQPNFTYVNRLQGLISVCTSFRKALMILDDHLWLFGKQLPCRTEYISGLDVHMAVAIPLPQHSPYKAAFNQLINKFREFGHLDRIRKSEFRRMEPPQPSGFAPVTMRSIMPLIFAVSVIYSLAHAIFISEVLYYKFIRNNKV